MRALVSLFVAVLVLVFVGASSAAITVSVTGAMDDVVPLVAGDFEWYRYCGTDPGPASPGMLWDCTTASDVDLVNPFTPSATGPGCDCNYGYGGELNRPTNFPIQLRWGIPVCPQVQQNGGTCTALDLRQSGFGFRPATTQNLIRVTDIFYFGMVAHFNYIILNHFAKQWTFTLKLTLDLNGVVQTRDFSYTLQLDETRNFCNYTGTNLGVACCDGCPSNPYWTNNPSSFVWPDCVPVDPNDGFQGNRLASNPQIMCCPYRGFSVCADRIINLNPFAAVSNPFTIDGLEYVVYLAGFSVPGTFPPVPRDYFISQEQYRTEAELYGRLIVRCPDTPCPGGFPPRLNAAGTACVCDCPVQGCPNPEQVQQADCSCICPNSTCGECGIAITNGNACSCVCADNCCPSGGVAVNDGAGGPCQCECPPSSCGAGQIINPLDPTCACDCGSVTCPTPGEMPDPSNGCQCVCPITACPGVGCTLVGCECTNCPNPCQSVCLADNECYRQECPPDGSANCIETFFPDAPCGSGNLCLQRCVDGVTTCQPQQIDCAAQLDLVALYGPVDAQCFDPACDPATGLCSAVPLVGQPCVLDLNATVGPDVSECYEAQCTPIGCEAVFLPNQPCTLSAAQWDGLEPQCYTPVCDADAGMCMPVPQVDKSCSDNDPCTVYPDTFDPVTGSPSDRCVPADCTGQPNCPSSGRELVCVGLISPCFDELDIDPNTLEGNCTFVCEQDITGHYCFNPCQPLPPSKGSAGQGAVIGAVLGTTLGCCCLALIAVAVAGVLLKLAGDAGLVPGMSSAAALDLMDNNPLYDQGGSNTNILYSSDAGDA